MGQRGPLRWLDGSGWLVLVGGNDWRGGRTGAIDPHILNLANLDRPLVVLSDTSPSTELESFVDYLVGCGAGFGSAYSLAECGVHAPELLEDVADAGVLYVLSEHPVRLVRQLRHSSLLERITEGYASEQGLIVVGYGAAAACFGAQVWQGKQVEEGLRWLDSIVVQPHYEVQAETLRALARQNTGVVGLGIPSDTAIAFGPHNDVLTWGAGEVTAVIHD